MSCLSHVVNDSPQPQDPFELGLLKVNSDLQNSGLEVSTDSTSHGYT